MKSTKKTTTCTNIPTQKSGADNRGNPPEAVPHGARRYHRAPQIRYLPYSHGAPDQGSGTTLWDIGSLEKGHPAQKRLLNIKIQNQIISVVLNKFI